MRMARVNEPPPKRGESLQPLRCDNCHRSLPVKVRLTLGSVVSIRCRHCTEATVRVGSPPPHWA